MARYMGRVVVVRREARRFGRENVAIECLDLSRCIEYAPAILSSVSEEIGGTLARRTVVGDN